MTSPPDTAATLDQPSESAWWVMALVFAGLSTAVAALNWHHLEQQTNFWNQYVSMAQHFAGTAPREVLTYPTWGYPFLLWVLPNHAWLVGLQVLLGVVAMTWAWTRVQAVLPSSRRLTTILFVAAVPWYALQSVKWPQAVAASLVVLAVLTLEHALKMGRVLTAAIAGVLFGGALYFRSEFLFLVPFLAVFHVVTNPAVRIWARLRIYGIMYLTTLLTLLPWALHFHGETGRYSLTASQGGIVAFISLGQLPGNPWGARYEDEYAFEYLEGQGLPSSGSSIVADSLLMAEFKRRVKENPGAYLKKVAWNGVRIVSGGFYNPEPRLDQASADGFTALRKSFRSMELGAGGAQVPGAAWAAFLYWLAAKSLGVLFVIVALIGLGRWLFWGPREGVYVLLCAGVIAYMVTLQMFLTAEPRYLNGVFLFAVPLFNMGLGLMRRPRLDAAMGGPTT